MKRWHILFLIILSVLVIDQSLKIYVKTHYSYGSGFQILGFPWANIHFVENKGMAFGITFGNKCLGISRDGNCQGILLTPEAGKLLLSTFRIVMVGFLIYLIRELYNHKEKMGVLVSLSLILAGAIGNIIDSAFYGLIFSQSGYHIQSIAEMFPESGGYASFLHGWVVDMFYFPLIDTVLPQWVPIWGGERFEFFRPVFNVADASISIGVGIILVFYRSFLLKGDKKKSAAAPAVVANSDQEE